MGSRFRRTLATTVVAIMVILLAGATYQGVATALERREFPPPGHLFDVGGHQLHLYCVGEGSPVIVLEAPAAGMSAAWGWVQPDLGRTTQTCSYDRAGLGWSEAGDQPFAATSVPTELHTLLKRAHLRGPFVLAGQSLGAAFASLFAEEYPAEVAGLVLIDPVGTADMKEPRDRFMRLAAAWPWLARTGVLRATRFLSQGATGLPEPSAGAVRAFLNRPDHLTRAGRELVHWDETIELARTSRPPVDRPMRVVKTRGGEPGSFLTDRESAATVSAAIRDVVSEVRALRK
jgi:pimeloyl-ACP methyl ester carboxylesterase